MAQCLGIKPTDAGREMERCERDANRTYPLLAKIPPEFVLYDDCPCLVCGPYAGNIQASMRESLPSMERVSLSIALFVAERCGLGPITRWTCKGCVTPR